MTRLHPSTCLVVSIIGAWSVLSCPTGFFGWLSVSPPRKPLPRLPLDVADFERLRTETPSYVYVDKTACLQYLVGGGAQRFLARPRRFGKTLLLDTIKCVFMKNGHKKDQLFKDLAITETNAGRSLLAQELPVVFLRMNRALGMYGLEVLMKDVSRLLLKEAKRHGAYVQPQDESPLSTLDRVIEAIRRNHGNKRVVFLVDEYDAAVTQVLEANGGGVDDRVQANLGFLKAFYACCKSMADTDFHYSLYTGVSRFASTSLFSGQNQLVDVSFDPCTASALGFTEDEVNTNFARHAGLLAAQGICLNTLARQYGGFRFSVPAEALFQPWALLNRFDQEQRNAPLVDAWAAQTPSWARKLLDVEKIPQVLNALVRWKPLGDYQRISVESFQELSIGDRVVLLQQCGYLTIQDMKLIKGQTNVRVSVPNQGVEVAFWRPGLNVSNDGEDNDLLTSLFEALQATQFENATALVDRLVKLAPWATALVKGPELQQVFAQAWSQWFR